MNALFKVALAAFSSLILISASAQTLPQVVFKPVFPNLQGGNGRPVWMSEAPDGSGRMFIVYQKGNILVAKKGSDDTKQFPTKAVCLSRQDIPA
jgi:hypothetical protein